MNDNRIVVSYGSVFAISDSTGDINEGTEEGLYANDTRFLSKYRVRLQTRPLDPLGFNLLNHSIASFYNTNPQVDGLPAATTSILRDRYLRNGLHEDIHVVNHSPEARSLSLEVNLDSDFADIFEVRVGNVQKTGRVTVERRSGQHLSLSYRRGSFKRETWIKFSTEPTIQGKSALFNFTLSPKQEWKTCVTVLPISDNAQVGPMQCVKQFVETSSSFKSKFPNRHGINSPHVAMSDSNLKRVYSQALVDLQMLRVKHPSGHDILAAGLPWFMALFGRDSIISAIQTQTLDPKLMENTLRVLAALQAKKTDVFREAQPGKILHEVRMGELSFLKKVPHSCYYGSIDSTPLFLRLLSETFKSTQDTVFLQSLLPSAEKAMRWIDRYGDIDGDGFVEYAGNPSRYGLKNQGWKDSNDSVSFADGRLATGPIALVEIQGYVYDAKQRMAETYRALGDTRRAVKLAEEAEQLRQHFEEAYWMPKDRYYALGLDGSKQQVDGIASNPGHCLWSNIVSPDHAHKMVDRLLAPDMFSGWGIRTLSTEMVRYNPLSYHNGSVWPHDNSIIATGMYNYGFKTEARKIANAIIEASTLFPKYRPPELFAGYPRKENSPPIAYPAANAPQAWASGAIIYLTENILSLPN